MKKVISIILFVVFCITGISVCADRTEDLTITLQIDNPVMSVNGEKKPIDEQGTAPVIINDRTLLPVRAIVEEIGGDVEWDGETQTVILACGKDIVVLGIDNTLAYHNEESHTLDVAPTIINDRTMLPIRFIAESFKFDVDWDGPTQTVTITKEAEPTAAPTVTPTTSPTAAPTASPTTAPHSTSTATPKPDTSANQSAISVTFGEGGERYTMKVEDNATTQFLLNYLGYSSLNLPVYHDGVYEGYEYYDIPSHYQIPDEPKAVTSVKAGEVYYADNQIILYYKDMKVKADYTKIGTIEDTDGLEEAVISNPVLEGWGNKIISLQALSGN